MRDNSTELATNSNNYAVDNSKLRNMTLKELLDTLKDVRKKIHEGSMSNKELIECRC
jgi:3'-phosphoadenosine 5'-phosphosulfate sulfotransferase